MRARPGQGHRFALIEQFLARLGAPAPTLQGLFGDEVLRRANALSFGRGQLPTIDLANARYVLSFGADFLGTWNSPVSQSVAYGRMRQGRPDVRGAFVQGTEGRRSSAARAAPGRHRRASAREASLMKAIYALYPDGQSAQQGVNRLRQAGIADRDIPVLSGQPMEHYEFGEMDRATWMWWIACAGGLAGMATAFGLAWVTEMFWPINVGGLPTFAWWPNLIIIFEMTMLGAILATVITLIVTAGLGRGGAKLYDPEVSDGKILVGVENPNESVVADLEKALGAPPGAELRRV